MERAYAPLVRQFSSIKGYQTGYTLVYSLDAAAEGSSDTGPAGSAGTAGQHVGSAGPQKGVSAAAVSL